jgi:hypothetical protein
LKNCQRFTKNLNTKININIKYMIIKKIYHKMKYYDINMNEFKKKISMIKNCLFKNNQKNKKFYFCDFANYH